MKIKIKIFNLLIVGVWLLGFLADIPGQPESSQYAQTVGNDIRGRLIAFHSIDGDKYYNRNIHQSIEDGHALQKAAGCLFGYSIF